MRFTSLIAAVALTGLMASSAIAANPAASLSLRGDDAQANTSPTEPVAAATAGGAVSTPLLLGGLALILAVIGAVALGHNDSTPASA
jgi:hypothetical protein